LDQNNLSLTQSNTIERLTYLTIMYLPISLMAALFAIPKEGDMFVLDNTTGGRARFAACIVAVSLFTYAMALFVGRILQAVALFFERPPPKSWPVTQPTPRREQSEPQDEQPTPQGGRRKGQPPNMWRYAGELSSWTRDNWPVEGLLSRSRKPLDEETPRPSPDGPGRGPPGNGLPLVGEGQGGGTRAQP